ncbi:MAG: M16 family metallopeptidase, partial [Bdellovibrionales bacterium]
FDQEPFERLRQEQLASIRFQLSSPGWQARYALFQSLYDTHPYGFRSLGTATTLQTLTPKKLATFAQTHLAKDNLVIAVVGAIGPRDLARLLDEVFGKLPAKAQLTPIDDIALPKPVTLTVSRPGTQTEVLFARPMLRREDPDWYAAQIANYILGGGGFVSRLMKEVRAHQGLTYGIGTGLSSMDHSALLVGRFSADNDKTAPALNRLSEVWQHFYDEGVTAQEVAAAKDYLIGSLPISLTSTDALAETVVTLQTEKLGRDYLDRYASLYEKVTPNDVNRVIRRWFAPTASYVYVGQPESVAADHQKPLMTE